MKETQQVEQGTEAPVVGLTSPQQIESTPQGHATTQEPEGHEAFPDQDPEKQFVPDPDQDPSQQQAMSDPPGEPDTWEEPDGMDQRMLQNAQEEAEHWRQRHAKKSGEYGHELKRLKDEIEELRRTPGGRPIPATGGGTFTPDRNVPRGTFAPSSEQERFYLEERRLLSEEREQQRAQRNIERGNTVWAGVLKEFGDISKFNEMERPMQDAVMEYVKTQNDTLQRYVADGDMDGLRMAGRAALDRGYMMASSARRDRLSGEGEETRRQAVGRKRHATPASAHGGRRPTARGQQTKLSLEELEKLPREKRKELMDAEYVRSGRHGFTS